MIFSPRSKMINYTQTTENIQLSDVFLKLLEPASEASYPQTEKFTTNECHIFYFSPQYLVGKRTQLFLEIFLRWVCHFRDCGNDDEF